MNRFLKTTVLSVTLAATALTAMPANAGGWHHRWDDDDGDALVAGVIGLAAGAILGGALAQPSYRYYEPRRIYRYNEYDPIPVYRYHAPRRVYRYRKPQVIYYGGDYEPWSRGWYQVCDARYRTFDRSSGTYMGYDGERHFCTLN